MLLNSQNGILLLALYSPNKKLQNIKNSLNIEERKNNLFVNFLMN